MVFPQVEAGFTRGRSEWCINRAGLTNPPPTSDCARLRSRCQNAGVTISEAAQASRYPSQSSEQAETMTTSLLPDTRGGSEPTNRSRHRFDDCGSIPTFCGQMSGFG